MSTQYHINSLVQSSPFVGINNQGQGYVPVQLNPSDDLWTITESNSNTYRFQIGGFEYTGVDGQGTVVATNDASRDVQWVITKQSGCGDNAHTIEILDSNPTVGWMVSNAYDSYSQIVIGAIDVSQCDSSQLFTGSPAN